MSKLITAFVLALILTWTLLSLGAWAVVGVGGDLLRAAADWTASDAPAIGHIFSLLQGLGFGVVIVVWAVGTVALSVIGLITRRFAQTIEVTSSRRWQTSHRPERFEPDPGMMKDITPRRENGRPELPSR